MLIYRENNYLLKAEHMASKIFKMKLFLHTIPLPIHVEWISYVVGLQKVKVTMQTTCPEARRNLLLKKIRHAFCTTTLSCV